MNSARKTVAVIGARGIGRHHANWWHRAKVDVVAVAGTSEKTNAQTAMALNSLFGFSGRCYTDVRKMIDEERPTFVDVCSPPEFHLEHVTAAFEKGCNVLCEKPLVGGTEKSSEQLLEQAQILADKGRRSGLVFGLCSQYAVAAEKCLSFCTSVQKVPHVETIAAELASPARDRPPDPRGVWMDLGPHLAACVQVLAPEGVLITDSLRVTSRPYDALCSFTVQRKNKTNISCSLHAFRTFGEPAHVRRIILNSSAFAIDGRRRPDGVYEAVYTKGTENWTDDDPMFILIKRMADFQPVLDISAALQNMEWLLTCHEQIESDGWSATSQNGQITKS